MTGLWKIVIPEATTNIMDNSSFETNTTGWAAVGTNTIARSIVQQFKGAYSLLCTYQNSSIMARYAAKGLTITSSYYLTAWIWVDQTWDAPNGSTIRIQGNAFSGAVDTYNSVYTHGTSPTNEWVYLETKFVTAGDITGDYDIATSGNPSAGMFLYLDAFQVEEKSNYPTTYCDGDQPGCRWSGIPHGSTSTRDAQSRSGGRVRNLDDLSAYIESHSGTGMPLSQVRFAPTINQDGAAFLGTTISPRVVQLDTRLIGTSLADLHSKRKTLIDALKPNLVRNEQLFTLRYAGADSNEEAEIQARYDSGLDSAIRSGFTDFMPLRFICDEPAWYSLGDRAVSLTTAATLNARGIMGYVNGVLRHFGPQSAGGQVFAIYVDDSRDIYVGGNFTNWDGIAAADYIVMWDDSAQSWSALGTPGINNTVYAIDKDSSGNIWIGGAFTTPQSYVMYWDGATWNAADGGSVFNGTVFALATSQTGRPWIGGSFTLQGASNMRRVAVYQGGGVWNEPNSGLNGTVSHLFAGPDGMYVGGGFTADGPGVTTGLNRIVRNSHAGTAGWTAFGNGVSNNSVFAVLLGSNGVLYVGGSFTQVDSVATDYFAYYTGGTWVPVSDGPDNDVNALAELPNGDILVGGDFNQLATYNKWNKMGVWDGLKFNSHLLQHDIEILRLFVNGEDIYIAYNSSANQRVPGTVTVTNNGTTDAYPKVIMKFSSISSGDAFFYSLDNYTTDHHIYLNFSYGGTQASDTITIDFNPDNPTIKSDLYGDLSNQLLSGSNFSGFRLIPGANTIGLGAYVTGSASFDVAYITWRERHWSLDGVAD